MKNWLLLIYCIIIFILITPTFAESGDVYLSDLKPFYQSYGFSLGVGIYPFSQTPTWYAPNLIPFTEGHPIYSRGITYSHGLFANAPSTIKYNLNGKYKSLTGTMLIDDKSSVGDGASFSILVDGKPVFTSAAITNKSKPQPFAVSVDGVKELTLKIDELTNNFSDYSIWGDPILSTNEITNEVFPKLAEIIPTSTSIIPGDFSDLHQCRTWWEALEKCPASVEDIKTGRLVEYAKSVMKPFHENAYRVFTDFDFGTTSWSSEADNKHAIMRPLRFYPVTDGLDDNMITWLEGGRNRAMFSSPLSPIGDRLFFLIKSKNDKELSTDVLAMVVKLLTKSGKIGYYILLDPQSFKKGDPYYSYFNLNSYEQWGDKMAFNPPLYNPEDWYKGDYDGFGSYLRDLVNDPGGKRKKLMDDWIETGDIPEELEKIPLFAWVEGKEGWGFRIQIIPTWQYPLGPLPTETMTPTITPTRTPRPTDTRWPTLTPIPTNKR